MKLEVRSDALSAVSLMERVLSPEHALAPEYPLVFAADAEGSVVVAEEAGVVHSACAILRRELLFPNGRGGEQSIRVGLIGSVSTGEDSRGRGLASSVLELAEQELLAEGCLFSLLWADSPEFYTARGYQPVGLEHDFVLDEAFCSALSVERQTRAAGLDDFRTLHEMYCTQPRRVQRDAQESAALYATPGMQILIAERAGAPVAYACLGRGHDLDGVIHEWAGDVDGVLACIQAHAAAQTSRGHRGPLFLMSSSDRTGVPQRLRELGAPFATGVLGMGKLLDPRGAADLLSNACEDQLEITLLDHGGAALAHKGRLSEILRSDWLDLLVAPEGTREPLEGLERRLQTSFPGLPWTPFVWGLDSI